MTQPNYDSYYSITVLNKELSSNAQMNRIKKIADVCDGSVLDLGAGLGKLGSVLKERGYQHDYLGVDIRQDYVDFMKKQGVRAIQSDILNEDFFDEYGFLGDKYDTVVIGDGIEHYDDFGKVLSHAEKVAKKKIVITLARESRDPPWHRWDIKWEECGDGKWTIIAFHRYNDMGEKV